jgi:hypothetical protein
MGLPGLAVFLALVWVTLRTTWKLQKKLRGVPDEKAQEVQQLSKAVFLAFLSISIGGLFGSQSYLWQLYMFIALAACLKQMAHRYNVGIE